MSKTTEHKEGQATVIIHYKTGKTLADGSHPFVIRITKNRKHLTRYTGISLHPKYWNAEKKEIRRSYPGDAKALWRKLEKKAKDYEEAAGALAEADEEHEAAAVLAKVSEQRKATRRVKLLAYVAELVAAQEAAGQLGNARVYRQTGTDLGRFILDEYGTDDISFNQVTVSFCHEWEQTMRAAGAEDTTLSVRFRTLRAVLNKAIAVGVAKPEHYPFARNRAEQHKYSVSKFDLSTRKRALPREELRKLEQLQPTISRQRLAKDAFLFSFYCGGINFVDLAQLRWRDVSGTAAGTGYPERLEYVRQKTGGKFSLKLLAPAAAILASYAPTTRATSESYVFPFLDLARHTTAAKRLVRLQNVLGWVNKSLKLLGEQAGISTPLTTYVARHSFATTLKLAGTNTAVISQAMGHKSEAVTGVYLDSFGSELVDEAFEGLL
ncbi:tyrosine-type recombinase/integrase [Hymenobacter lutimineralis]|uniref:Tyrosine-type recombinase/integrase n=1 Tax=Hymenobacter lutimineralis TaxID=2606448 RepID=A0A5D6V6P7_9BACT|nr:site-specific integrase [Hymenobacter lutimineralis]TYZ10598.1 tyrosine-type recombinase/integrase [Hymenobacter lutimineralis]